MNKWIGCGNLGRDPDVRHTQAGRSVMNFTMATTRVWRDKTGERHEETEWHRIVYWGRGPKGEIGGVREYLQKGRQVIIEGRVQTRSYEKDGDTKYVTEIVAQEIELVGGRRDNGSGKGGDRKEDGDQGDKTDRYPDREPAGAGAGDPPPGGGYDLTEDDIPF